MNLNEEVTHVLTCYHCGNKTLMKQIAHTERVDKENFSWGGLETFYITFYTHWDLYLCPVCDNVTLLKTTKSSEEIDQNGNLVPSESVIYPSVSLEESGIPEVVKKSFEAALRIRNVEGTLCAIGIRRTLEMMCKDRQANGKDLYHRLIDLSDRGILPPIVNEMASVLRELGNEAAHGDDTEFSDELVNSMIKFTHVILDYVYNLPEKLNNIQNHLRKTVEGSASLQSTLTVKEPNEAVGSQNEGA